MAWLKGPAYCAQVAFCEVENSPRTTTETPARAHLHVSFPIPDADPTTPSHLQTNQFSARLKCIYNWKNQSHCSKCNLFIPETCGLIAIVWYLLRKKRKMIILRRNPTFRVDLLHAHPSHLYLKCYAKHF